VSAAFEADVFIKERDATDLLALRSAVWGADHPHTNAAFLRWLYAQAPALEPCGSTVRMHGKLVGFAGLSRKRIVVDGRNAESAHGLDYMIMPELKGLAAGQTAIRTAQRWRQLMWDSSCAIGLVFPNEAANRIHTSDHVGLKPMFQPALMLRPLPRIALTEDIKRIPRRLGTTLLRMAAVYGASRSALAGAGADLQAEARFGPDYDDLWASIADRVRIGLVRDSAYLNWRYVDHPVYQYERLSLRSGHELQGLVVGSPRDTFGVNSMLLVDLVAKDDDVISSCNLIEGLVRHARRQGREMVVALAIPGTKLYTALKRCGFLHVPERMDPKPFRTAGIVNTEAATCAWDPTAWYFTWGDMDVV